MNILYISNLSGNLFAGPNNSVPAQISAQALSDNVFWYNLNHIKREEWKSIGCCNFDDYPTGRLKDLPLPFSKSVWLHFQISFLVKYVSSDSYNHTHILFHFQVDPLYNSFFQ